MKAIRTVSLNKGGGNSKLTDIDDFSYYNDKKHRAKIKGELREISERDFITLQYVFLENGSLAGNGKVLLSVWELAAQKFN